jgi:hypothetical protein
MCLKRGAIHATSHKRAKREDGEKKRIECTKKPA